MALTILEGSTFCICDERGDIEEQTSGFFSRDTRFLSILKLMVNGERPMPLSSGLRTYYWAAFYLRNPPGDELPPDTVLIVRERFVGETMQERVAVTNEAAEPLEFDLTLEFGTDFADILVVKSLDVVHGDPSGARSLPARVEPVYRDADNQILLGNGATGPRTQIILSERGDVRKDDVVYRLSLEPRETWEVRIDVVPGFDGPLAAPSAVEQRFDDEQRHIDASVEAWHLSIPHLRAEWDDLERTFTKSVADLASLRIRGRGGVQGQLPAAGMPWFMTVFGRDTIITCLQTQLFGPELARSALTTLAALQAREDDPEIDAEPGKIVHEVRDGKAAEAWHRAYYGSVDATPLYLILLSEVWRWTADGGLVRMLREPALRALEWIDTYGDGDGDGFVEYQCRAPRGIENQSWKDSGDSQRFADGRKAESPIAPVEVQGYVYDAKLRVAELAREVWRDRELATRLERQAAELQERFEQAFWIEERGGYYALALDRDKRPVDSLCSNMGHLLWSGIVRDESRVDAVVDRLMSPDGLWSGWGVRTMAATEGAYNPLSYHNGTVWPHDNSLIAWGLANYGRWEEAHRIIRRMLEAAASFDYGLPEVFAGLGRLETSFPKQRMVKSFPIEYPTAARPQAWAAGTPVLLLQLLLGLRPNTVAQELESVAPAKLPSWVESLRLNRVHAFEAAWDVRLQDGAVDVSRTY